MSLIEREGFRQHVETARAEAAARRIEEQTAAAESAVVLWQSAVKADEHDYLAKKGVGAHGVRIQDGTLLVPMRDAAGNLVNVQRIGPDGAKRFMRDAKVTGCYHAIGKPNGVLCIAEGYATAASIHEATGHAVAVAFNAGNLETVARELHAKYPETRLIFCADDDAGTDGNPGITKATEAARVVGGLIAVPEFGSERPEGATDFNDMARQHGAEAVERAVANARLPEPSIPPPAGHDAPEPVLPREWTQAVDEAAFHGIAGELVQMIEPHTEADPAAILVQTLVSFGALVGRGPHYRVEGDKHHANLYALMVGATAKGRKGTSWGRVREIFERIEEWKHHVSGLSSGEGVKFHVRDAREELKENKHGENVLERSTSELQISGCSSSSPNSQALSRLRSVRAAPCRRRSARDGIPEICGPD